MKRAPRLLLIDDDDAVIRILGESLKAEGFEVIGMTCPPTYICDVDAVVTDLRLEDTDGAETLEAVMAAAPGKPVVVLSGLVTPPRREQAILAGAEAVVEKGEDPRVLVVAIREALARRRRAINPEAALALAKGVIAELRLLRAAC